MLTDDLKDTIRQAYNALMESKQLTPRWGQRQMIAEIANTLGRIPGPGEGSAREPAVCVIEAGTGTGKTIAYAVTAIPMAQALDKRLVVATATIALQVVDAAAAGQLEPGHHLLLAVPLGRYQIDLMHRC